MNQAQFEMIIRRMEQRYGRMHKGDEEAHAMVLFAMEGNLLKTHRKHPESNSRRLKEAICLTFHRVNGYLNGKQDDVTKFESTENLLLRDALLQAFDPFTREEIRDVMCGDGGLDLNDRQALENYFEEPIRCIRRIYDSVEHWEKESGSNGYFVFIENWMGSKIPYDDKMDYSVQLGAESIERLGLT